MLLVTGSEAYVYRIKEGPFKDKSYVTLARIYPVQEDLFEFSIRPLHEDPSDILIPDQILLP